jgi:8-oxo-dGTP pyrophosphatase MutT (NUDIX family)
MPGRFLAMAGALIWRESDGRYLILKRSIDRDVGAGAWEQVTGRLEQGEAFEEALAREVSEETGLDVRVEMVLGTSHFYRGAEAQENEMVGVTYGCSTSDGSELRLSDEHSEYKWVTVVEAR